MSLFVGNLSRNVPDREVHEEFKKYGPCSYVKKVRITHHTPFPTTTVSLFWPSNPKPLNLNCVSISFCHSGSSILYFRHRDLLLSLNLKMMTMRTKPRKVSMKATWEVADSTLSGASSRRNSIQIRLAGQSQKTRGQEKRT